MAYTFFTINENSNNLTIIDKNNIIHSTKEDNINLNYNCLPSDYSKNNRIIDVFAKLNNLSYIETELYRYFITVYINNNYTDNLYRIYLFKEDIENIANNLNTSVSTIKRRLSDLIVKGIIKPHKDNCYTICPKYDISKYINNDIQFITIKF